MVLKYVFYLSFNFIVEKLLAEDCQGVVCAVVVKVQGVENALHVRGVLCGENVVGKDPWH